MCTVSFLVPKTVLFQTKTIKKTHIQKHAKYNARNHKTIVFIVGGQYDKDTAPTPKIECVDTIYYAFSDDLNPSSKRNKMWRKSKLELREGRTSPTCVILNKERINPIFLVLAGKYTNYSEYYGSPRFLQWGYQMSDILDIDTHMKFTAVLFFFLYG